MAQKVIVILSWINPSQNIGTKVNNLVLKIQTNRWLGLNIFRPNRQKVLQFQVFGLKNPGQRLSIHRAIISVMGNKVMAILSWINPSQNIGTRVNNIVLKILTNHRLGLNNFRPKRQKVLQFKYQFGLKIFGPKAFHWPCDNSHLWVKKLC